MCGSFYYATTASAAPHQRQRTAAKVRYRHRLSVWMVLMVVSSRCFCWHLLQPVRAAAVAVDAPATAAAGGVHTFCFDVSTFTFLLALFARGALAKTVETHLCGGLTSCSDDDGRATNIRASFVGFIRARTSRAHKGEPTSRAYVFGRCPFHSRALHKPMYTQHTPIRPTAGTAFELDDRAAVVGGRAAAVC